MADSSTYLSVFRGCLVKLINKFGTENVNEHDYSNSRRCAHHCCVGVAYSDVYLKPEMILTTMSAQHMLGAHYVRRVGDSNPRYGIAV